MVLTQDETGRVTGAIAERADGSYVKYNASDAVVLAAGDYGSNPQMVWALQGELVEWAMRAGKNPEDVTGMSGGMGDGIKMGCWAGGFMEAAPRACNQNGAGAGGPWGVCGMLWLNAAGKRFMNEASVQQNMPVILRQPKGIIAVDYRRQLGRKRQELRYRPWLAQLWPTRLLLRAAGRHGCRRD